MDLGYLLIVLKHLQICQILDAEQYYSITFQQDIHKQAIISSKTILSTRVYLPMSPNGAIATMKCKNPR